MEDLLKEKYWGNTVQEYLIAVGGVVVGLLILRLFKTIVLVKLKKKAAATETNVDDLVVHGIEKFVLPVLNFVFIYSALNYLVLSEKVEKIVSYASAAVVTYFVVRIITRTISLALKSYVRKEENGEEKIKQMRGIIIVINVMIWALGLVFLFDNLGYNVTAIITGLGIGGIAIALAAQNILGDLFNYFVIFFDRPFEIGDFIEIDNKSGDVEYIGIKSTRIKAQRGEQIIISNSDLTKSRVHNFKKLKERRIVFSIGVTYDTPYEKVQQIPSIIKKAIEAEKLARFDRSHFLSFGSYSLNFETVYYVLSAEYHDYMNVQQNINFAIMKEFEQQGIEFAFPTQNIILNKENQ